MRKWLAISAIIVALDLYTKHLIQGAFAYGEMLTFTSYFDLVHYHNEGSAFGFCMMRVVCSAGSLRAFLSLLLW
jgi:signal peptidase II